MSTTQTDAHSSWRFTSRSLGTSLIIYAALCLLYELMPGATSAAPTMVTNVQQKHQPDKPRFEEWDLIKFVLHYCIVLGHITMSFVKNSPNFFFDMWANWFLNFGVAFEMSCFAFVSGVFGQNISLDAMSKMLCYTVGAAYLVTNIVRVFYTITTPIWAYNPGLWYLISLAWWRLLISPMFHVGAENGIPKVFLFAVVCGLSYTGWRTFSLFPSAFRKIVLSSDVFVLAPYFAAGQLLPMSRWTSLLRDYRLTLIGITFVSVWYLCLAFFPSFQAWNEVANLGCSRSLYVSNSSDATILINFLTCSGNRHFPHQYYPPMIALTLDVLKVDVTNFLLKGAITLAMLWTLAAPLDLFKRVAPLMFKIVLRSGTRTIYGYILHTILISYLIPDKTWTDIAAHVPVKWIPVLLLSVTMFLVMIFTSSLTVRLCEWMIFPYWSLRVCRSIQNVCEILTTAVLGVTSKTQTITSAEQAQG